MNDGQSGGGDGDRRSFASRTPVNANPDQVVYRRGFVTRHQASGWRFMMRRIASGVALHDTRMLVEPLRTQARSVLLGLLALATIAAGCFVFTLIWPNTAAGNDTILADRSTSALYVRLEDQLHPVLNLTSARLIAGQPVNPTTVRSTALDKFSRGNLIGIPGAPERMVQTATRDAKWAVCEAVSGPAAGVTVIAGPVTQDGSRAQVLEPGWAVLATGSGASWLLWDGKRSRIDLADRAVTSALGIGPGVSAPRPISLGLFNAVPEAPVMTVPVIPEAGSPPGFGLRVPAPVGAVVESYALDTGRETDQADRAGRFDADRDEQSIVYYAVLSDGLQPISGVVAALLRNSNSYGLDRPPRLGPDEVAKLPVSWALDTSVYPERPVSITDPVSEPVTCAQWSKPEGASTSSLVLLSGSTLPLADNAGALDLVGGGIGGVADRVALPPGTGYFVQSTGDQAVAQQSGALFWISDTGVRYGVDTETDTRTGDGPPKTVTALGLVEPALPIPSAVLKLLAPGPTLSRDDALLAHDGLAPDQRPGRVATTGAAGPTTREASR